MIKDIVNKEPLSITLSGENASFHFDYLLNFLSIVSSTKHIMTGLIDDKDIQEIVETFLISTWPSEERFDEWTSYNILFITNDLNDSSLLDKINLILS